MPVALDFDAGSWDPVVRVVPYTLGIALFILTALSLVRTMVIPRAIPSVLTASVNRVVNHVYALLARTHRSFEGRDRILAWNGPVAVFATLVLWLGMFVLSYALMLYGISDASFGLAFVSAGSALFTLGLVGSPSIDETYVEFIAAATGPVVIALLIGFLPTLYGSWNTRESHAALLGTIAGEPAWGPELLARTTLLGTGDRLGPLFTSWTRWAADVRLSQTLYPPLSRMRSAIARRHWLISLLAVVDAAALSNALNSKGPRVEALALVEEGALTMNALLAVEWNQRTTRTLRRTARRAFAPRKSPPDLATFMAQFDEIPMTEPGITAVRKAVSIDTLNTGVGTLGGDILRHETAPVTITRAEFDTAVDMLRASGFPIDIEPDRAWEYFAASRQRYEFAAYSLARTLQAVRAPWSGPRSPDTTVIVPASAIAMTEAPDASTDDGSP